MNRYSRFIAAAILLAVAAPASAALNILACEPEWGALAQELGGDKVNVYNATNAFQDPHHIQAKPSLLARARNADMLVCTGSQLEIGWLPVLLQQSGNPKIQPGKPGYFEAARFVRMLEVPTRLDRADGDVHPGGNPHIQTDPRNIALVATGLAKQLAEADPSNAAWYQARYQAFSGRWQLAVTRWEKESAPLKGVPIVVQHKGFPYLENWLGLREVATLEPKPGVEPSSGHLVQVLEQLQRQPAKMILRAAYNDGRPSEWLAERAKISAVALPFTVGGSEQAKDLFSLFDDTVQRLLAAAK
ncbi:zinc ABC transporter substrate-binding protein [Sulfurimicrobium lacus]|uniref:Zinc ABC transporter substrate-binding protein n=1 Tax=Sulfurimicrobium lacus TaxID=2715678 RepID=A0A6F8V7C2_9PROT|nr:zinc ABC transporter substrate-binding protein [Sulfurimicrobium lacus]BCB25210.1 zinc ABC transporter substrate-binding protein [Sulfurimicrobium lacus]